MYKLLYFGFGFKICASRNNLLHNLMMMDFLCVKLLLFSVLKVFARDELQPSYDSVDQCASSIYAFSFALVCDDIFKNTHA